MRSLAGVIAGSDPGVEMPRLGRWPENSPRKL